MPKPQYSVYDYDTAKVLDGRPSDDLIRRSYHDETGAVRARLEGGGWVADEDGDRTVYVDRD